MDKEKIRSMVKSSLEWKEKNAEQETVQPSLLDLLEDDAV